MGSAASAEIIPKEYLVINASPVPQPKVTPPFSSLSILLPAGLFTEKGLLNMPRTIGGWFPERRALPSLYWYQHLLREREMRCLLSAFLMANQTHRALSLHILYLTAIMCMPREDINNPTTLFEHPYFNLEGYETLALLMWGLQSHPGTGAGREQGLGCQSQLSRAFPWNSSLLGCGSTECCSIVPCPFVSCSFTLTQRDHSNPHQTVQDKNLTLRHPHWTCLITIWLKCSQHQQLLPLAASHTGSWLLINHAEMQLQLQC